MISFWVFYDDKDVTVLLNQLAFNITKWFTSIV